MRGVAGNLCHWENSSSLSPKQYIHQKCNYLNFQNSELYTEFYKIAKVILYDIIPNVLYTQQFCYIYFLDVMETNTYNSKFFINMVMILNKYNKFINNLDDKAIELAFAKIFIIFSYKNVKTLLFLYKYQKLIFLIAIRRRQK
jgi:hypothetical protein